MGGDVEVSTPQHRGQRGSDSCATAIPSRILPQWGDHNPLELGKEPELRFLGLPTREVFLMEQIEQAALDALPPSIRRAYLVDHRRIEAEREELAAVACEAIPRTVKDGPYFSKALDCFKRLPLDLVNHRQRATLASIWTWQSIPGGPGAMSLPLPSFADREGLNLRMLRRDLNYLIGLGLVDKTRPEGSRAGDNRPSSYRVRMAAVLDALEEAGVEEYRGWDERMQ